MKSDLYVEFKEKQINQKALIDMAKEIWRNNGNKVKDLNTVDLYYKPEESKCYYVFNGESTQSNYFEV